MKSGLSLVVPLLALLMAGCGRTPIATVPPAAPSDTNVVATVNGAIISRRAVEERLKRGGRNETPAAALDELIRIEAIYQKALAEGFDRQADVQARIKNLIVGQFRERQARLAGSSPLTDAEIQAAFEAQKERFQTPAKVRGAVIFIEAAREAVPEKRAELQKHAEAVLTEARAATDDRTFAQVVARYSEDRPTRYRGGDTGWLGQSAAAYEPALTEALVKLDGPGEFAPLVETSRGFYVVKLIEKQDAKLKPLGEVKDALRYQLSRQKTEQAEREFSHSIQSGLTIEINRALLGAISVPPPLNEPPPPGPTTAQLP